MRESLYYLNLTIENKKDIAIGKARINWWNFLEFLNASQAVEKVHRTIKNIRIFSSKDPNYFKYPIFNPEEHKSSDMNDYYGYQEYEFYKSAHEIMYDFINKQVEETIKALKQEYANDDAGKQVAVTAAESIAEIIRERGEWDIKNLQYEINYKKNPPPPKPPRRRHNPDHWGHPPSGTVTRNKTNGYVPQSLGWAKTGNGILGVAMGPAM
jgi:hypothetical protein